MPRETKYILQGGTASKGRTVVQIEVPWMQILLTIFQTPSGSPSTSPNSQSNLKKEEESWRHHTSWFQIILQAVVIKTVWYWYKNRYIYQWNTTQSPDIHPCIYSQLIFDQGTKNTQWGQDGLFNKWYWENWISTCRRMKMVPCHTPLTKINSK